MKTVFIVLAVLALTGTSRAQSPAEAPLHRQLTAPGAESVAALDLVLAKAESVSTVMLYTAASTALDAKRLEDAGFLFYVARFRALFDLELFSPNRTGRDSPMALFDALQEQVGLLVNPALMAEPKVFAKVLGRVRLWTPGLPPAYEPGWAFFRRGTPLQAAATMRAARTQFMGGMEGFSTLLLDDAYFAAFKVGRDYHTKRGDDRPSQQAFDAAMVTMARIESEKGIDGVAARTRQ